MTRAVLSDNYCLTLCFQLQEILPHGIPDIYLTMRLSTLYLLSNFQSMILMYNYEYINVFVTMH